MELDWTSTGLPLDNIIFLFFRSKSVKFQMVMRNKMRTDSLYSKDHRQDWEPVHQYQCLILPCQCPLDCVLCVNSSTRQMTIARMANRELGPANQLTIWRNNNPIINQAEILKSRSQMKHFSELRTMATVGQRDLIFEI